MKKFRELLSLVLVVVMVCAVSVTAWATTETSFLRSSKTGNFYGASGNSPTSVSFKVSKGETEANVSITVPSSQEYRIELFADLKSLGSYTESGNAAWDITNIDYTTSCKVRITPKGSGATYYYTITGA